MFITNPLSFEKVAAAKLLDDDPEKWQGEALSELYKSHHYLGEYQVDLQVKSQDEEKGYLFGYFLITPTEALPPQSPMSGTVNRPELAQVEAQAAKPGGKPALRIPVIVQDRKLSTFDVMIDAGGEFLPLTEQRVSEAMSMPGNFEVVRPPDTASDTVANEFTPPQRTGISGGNATVTPLNKTSSILEKVANTISSGEKDRFIGRLDDPGIIHALENNVAFKSSVEKVYLAKTASGPEVVQKLKMWLPSSAVHFEKVSGGFMMHSANAGAYEPEQTFIPRENSDLIPSEFMPRLQKEGSVLISEEGTFDADETEFSKIEKVGHYVVATAEGDVTNGVVIPEVTNLEGDKVDSQLFFEVPRSRYAYQEKVAGSYVGPATLEHLRVSDPVGEGVFVKVGSAGVEAATLPLTITNRVTVDDETSFLFESEEGKGRIKVAEGLVRPFRMSEDTYAIPSSWEFVSTGELHPIVAEPTKAKTASSVGDLEQHLQIVHSGGLFSFRGGCGVSDLPHDNRELVKKAEAMLLLGCLGLSETYAKVKLAQAERKGICDLHATRKVESFKNKMASAREIAREYINKFQIPQINLIKEAAALTDEASVDSVLSLGFLTPENAAAYLESLDTFEQTVRKLAELLIAVRLGMKDVPEAAASKALSGTEVVLQGLKSMKLRVGEAQNRQMQVQ
jgi:hypothetical protein